MTANGPLNIWGYGQDQDYALVTAAVRMLLRDGVQFKELRCPLNELTCHWARTVAECLSRGDCRGGVLFCTDPGLVACVANKVPGVRAVPVSSVGQSARATLSLAANLLCVEMPGRTFFEIRQILRLLIGNGSRCPEGLACTLRELDGYAHR